MTSPDLTPNDVHDVAFGKPPIGSRGYDEDQVDAFLDRAEKDLAAGLPLGDAVASARFTKPPLGKRGYDEGEVDAFLDRLAATDPGHVAGPGRSAVAGSAVSESPFVESPGLLARLFRRR